MSRRPPQTKEAATAHANRPCTLKQQRNRSKKSGRMEWATSRQHLRPLFDQRCGAVGLIGKKIRWSLLPAEGLADHEAGAGFEVPKTIRFFEQGGGAGLVGHLVVEENALFDVHARHGAPPGKCVCREHTTPWVQDGSIIWIYLRGGLCLAVGSAGGVWEGGGSLPRT